jgi:hypothetical protein
MTEHACKSCGYHVHAPGCAAVERGGWLMSGIERFVYRLYDQRECLCVTHCWLPIELFADVKAYLGMSATPIAVNCMMAESGIETVSFEIAPHDADVTAWAFREPNDGDE